MPVSIFHAEYRDYTFGGSHPFSPVRIDMMLDLLMEAGVPVSLTEPPAATDEEILSVHTRAYMEAVMAASADPTVASEAMGLDTPDNPIVPGFERGARRIVGGTLHGARLIADGREKRVLQLGGGLHHAMPELASGFCIYNDLAIAIRELTSRGLNVAYLDIDVHHGDGVQQIFYDEEKVLTISCHESGEYLFPGTGWLHELGRGSGRGFKLNIPFEPFTEGDNYVEVCERLIEPALGYFRPDVLVLQAGADAHFGDPLADLMLTSHAYERLFRLIVELAETFTQGRLLVTLGGGYSLVVTPRIWALLYLVLFDQPIFERLPEAWVERWRPNLGPEPPETLHDPPEAYEAIPRKEEIERHNRLMVQRLQDSVSMLWL